MTQITDLALDGRGDLDVSLDEGGLRCAWPHQATYVPLSAIADVRVEEGLFGGVSLVLVGMGGSSARLRLSSARSVELHGLLLRALHEQRTDDTIATGRTPSALARDGRSIDEWLAGATRLAMGTYRRGA